MKILTFLTLVGLLGPIASHAQLPVGALSGAAGEKIYSVNLSVSRLQPITEGSQWNWGYGMHYTAIWAWDKIYSTAPYELISAGKTQNITVDYIQTHSFNFAVHLQRSLSNRWVLGLSLDLAGVTTGGASGSPPLDETKYNYFGFHYYDYGNLNTELYLGFPISELWSLRVGINRYTSEIRTNDAQIYHNKRFRHITHMIFVGISGQ